LKIIITALGRLDQGAMSEFSGLRIAAGQIHPLGLIHSSSPLFYKIQRNNSSRREPVAPALYIASAKDEFHII
jgi:hypothetical protein